MVTPLASFFGEAVKAISHLGVAQRMEEGPSFWEEKPQAVAVPA